MRKVILCTLCLLVLLNFKSYSQYAGARALGLAGNSLNSPDVWSGFNNIGSLAYLENGELGSYFHLPYGLSELSELGFSFTAPTDLAHLHIGLYRQGNDQFNQQKLNIGASKKVGNFSYGMSLQWHQTMIAEYGQKSNLLINMGGMARVVPKLSFGIHLENLGQARLIDNNFDYIKSSIRAGFSYELADNLKLHAEGDKEIREDFLFRSALEYVIQKSLITRIGFTTRPLQPYGGFGFKWKKWAMDYALSRHFTLGVLNQLSLQYTWREKRG